MDHSQAPHRVIKNICLMILPQSRTYPYSRDDTESLDENQLMPALGIGTPLVHPQPFPCEITFLLIQTSWWKALVAPYRLIHTHLEGLCLTPGKCP